MDPCWFKTAKALPDVFRPTWSPGTRIVVTGALCGVAAAAGAKIEDRRRKTRNGSMPAGPPSRTFGIATSGSRLFVVPMDARSRMIGEVQEYASTLREIGVTEVKRLGLVTARRYRIEFADGTELNVETQATKSAELFFRRIAELVPKPPMPQVG